MGFYDYPDADERNKKCEAPMERPMPQYATQMCRFCGCQMDGWMPDPKSEAIPVLRGHTCLWNGFTIVKKDGLTLVTGHPSDIQPIRVSGTRHHFDNPEVKKALLGKDK